MPLLDPDPVASPTASDSDNSFHSHKDIPAATTPPTSTLLDKAADLLVVDVRGEEVRFKSLYWAEPGQTRKVMVFFIRHFFCGNCQEYIRTLCAELPPSSLPSGTAIAIVGCGSHTLIPSYIELTSCPYPIYADPNKRLFKMLGMQRNLSLGWKSPQYIQHTLLAGVGKSIVQGLKRIGEGDVTKAGGLSQNGGEFLIEVEGADLRCTSPEGTTKRATGNVGMKKVQVPFCHRMQNTRDHTEVSVVAKTLLVSEDEERSSRRLRLDRRRTTSNGIAGLARSLSNRGQRFLERRNSSSWSRTRQRSRSRNGAVLGEEQRTHSPEHFETVREEVRSRDGPESDVPAAKAEGDAQRAMTEGGAVESQRFSFDHDRPEQLPAA